MSEKIIETKILSWLNSQPGFFAWKNQSTGVFDPVKKVFRKSKNPFLINGVPDILGFIKNPTGHAFFLGIEVKKDQHQKLSGYQLAFMMKATSMNVIYFSAYSVAEVKKRLSDYLYLT